MSLRKYGVKLKRQIGQSACKMQIDGHAVNSPWDNAGKKEED